MMMLLNALLAGASGVLALLALPLPELQLPQIQLSQNSADLTAVTYYAEMYAVRGMVVAAGLVLVAFRTRPNRPAVLLTMLAVAGVIQIGDSIIGLVHGTPAVAGGLTAAALHLGTMVWMLRVWVLRQRKAGLGWVALGDPASSRWGSTKEH